MYLCKLTADLCNDGVSHDVIMCDTIEQARTKLSDKLHNEFHVTVNGEETYTTRDEERIKQEDFYKMIDAIRTGEEFEASECMGNELTVTATGGYIGLGCGEDQRRREIHELKTDVRF